MTRKEEIIKILDDCDFCSSSGCCMACDDTCDNHKDIRKELEEIFRIERKDKILCEECGALSDTEECDYCQNEEENGI
ncbi:MAG: hypothetical protein V3V19_11125 [Cocleimonas sp.]